MALDRGHLWTFIGIAGVAALAVVVGVVVYSSFSGESVVVRQESDGRQTLLRGDVLFFQENGKPLDPRDWHDSTKDFSRVALTYYHRSGPVGHVLGRYDWFPGPRNTFRADARLPAALVGSLAAPPGAIPMEAMQQLWSEPPVGVVFLHAASVASYGRPFQCLDFFDRNPAMIELFERDNPRRRFHVLQDAVERGVNVRLFEGPELEALRQGPKGYYRVLIVEMSRSSQYPLRYIREHATPAALRIFADALADDGIICFHTSSRHDRILADLATVAMNRGFAAVSATARGSPTDREHFASEWLLVARRGAHLGFVTTPPAGGWPADAPKFEVLAQ
jgi:hypothetical protein